jgi:hypothetical protein
VRRVAMQDVPTLEANSLDFIFVRQLRIDVSVDQQAELESVLVITFIFIFTFVFWTRQLTSKSSWSQCWLIFFSFVSVSF